MGQSLKGKVAVVTGAGRGIGRATATLMAQEGASVVVNDIGSALSGDGTSTSPADEVVTEIRKQGGTAVANYDSVASLNGGQAIIKTALDNFKRIDILVNNAGVLRAYKDADVQQERKKFTETTEEDLDTLMAVNVKGPFACILAALPEMMKQGSGRIINLSSSAAIGVIGGGVDYCASKAGVLGLTRALAQELGECGISVCAILPAAMTRLAKTTGQQPEAVATLIAYLSSDKATNINGRTFAVRIKGTVQLFKDPEPIRSIYSKDGWTIDMLAEALPNAILESLPPVKPILT